MFYKKIILIAFLISKIWLHVVLVDHHHFGYNTKLPEKTLSRKLPNAQWTKSKSKRKPQRRIPRIMVVLKIRTYQ
jgi:hypothetical protein